MRRWINKSFIFEIYRKVLYKSRGFYDFLGEILQASIMRQASIQDRYFYVCQH